MDFKDSKAIYLQIADIICENILSGKWAGEERIPSVREIAVEMEVNPNTAVRAYIFLQEKNIIQNKRGIGYFISPDGYNVTLELKKDEFLKDDVKIFFRKMGLLKISFKQIEELYKKNSGI